MPKNPNSINIYVSDETRAQLAELEQALANSRSGVIREAVRALYERTTARA